MSYQLIIEVDSDLDLLGVHAEEYATVLEELGAMQVEFPNHSCPDGGTMMPGTRVQKGRKAIFATAELSSEDPATLLEGMIEAYGLDWELWTLQSLGLQLVVDVNGDPILDENDERQYAILIEKPLDSGFQIFLNDVGDPPVRPSLPRKLHQRAGWAQMVVE